MFYMGNIRILCWVFQFAAWIRNPKDFFSTMKKARKIRNWKIHFAYCANKQNDDYLDLKILQQLQISGAQCWYWKIFVVMMMLVVWEWSKLKDTKKDTNENESGNSCAAIADQISHFSFLKQHINLKFV